jgi:hypothetical protein
VTTVIRQYRAVADTVWGERGALLLTRSDSLLIESRPESHPGSDSSSDTTDSMHAAGTGRAEFTLYVDPSSGVLLQSTGESHTEILVTTRSSRFPFREDARQTITLVR